MSMVLDYKKYETFCAEIMEKSGVLPETAKVVSEILVKTDMMGTSTHGTANLGGYMAKVVAGGFDGKAKPEIVKEGPTWAIVDGHYGLGPASGFYSIELAMKKAKETGMAYVGTINSNHYGACGVYSTYAAEHGFLAITMSNSNPNMNIPGSKGKGISNSPISYAAPAGKGHRPIFMDIALSQVAALKVFNARDNNQSVPDGWIVDADGRPTNSPAGNEWSLLPIGMHKGYCLAFMVKIMCEVLCGGSPVVNSWVFAPKDVPAKTSHACIVIDVKQIMGEEAFAENMGVAMDQVTSLPKAEGSNRVWLPGEMEWEKYEKAMNEGLVLSDITFEKVTKLAESLGMDISVCEKK